jgi:hypothetical protein
LVISGLHPCHRSAREIRSAGPCWRSSFGSFSKISFRSEKIEPVDGRIVRSDDAEIINGIVLDGQNGRGKLRRRRQNVTCALEVLSPDQKIRHRYRVVHREEKRLGLRDGSAGSWGSQAIATSARAVTKQCICRIINDLFPFRAEKTRGRRGREKQTPQIGGSIL